MYIILLGQATEQLWRRKNTKKLMHMPMPTFKHSFNSHKVYVPMLCIAPHVIMAAQHQAHRRAVQQQLLQLCPIPSQVGVPGSACMPAIPPVLTQDTALPA